MQTSKLGQAIDAVTGLGVLKRAGVTVLLITFAAGVLAQETNNPQPGVVSDEATGVKLAEKALERIYGKKQIQSEKPFTAKLTDDI
jgi:hypothetical protein